MIRRLAVTTTLGAVAAATLIASSTTGGQLALTNMTTPISNDAYSIAAPPPAPRKCPPNFVAGTIGGQSKCLAPGQQCQQAHVSDYTHYGFTCNKAGNAYKLTKTSNTRPGPAKPPVSAKPAPVPAKPHH